MKLVLDNIVFSLQKAGGISVVWYELLVRLLKDKKIHFSFLEYDHSLENIFRENLAIRDVDTIASYSILPLWIRRYIGPFLPLRRNKFIFHSSYYRTCKNKQAINITTIHDFTYEYFTTGLQKKIHCWQKYQAIKNSDVIICISENTKQDLIKFIPNIDVKKIQVIYNGVSDNYYRVPKSEIGDLPYAEGTYLMFVGSRVPYKNYKLALEVVAATDFNFVIVGANLTNDEENDLNIKLGKERYKQFRNVPDGQLNKFYNGAFALLYLSSYEGFGIPVLEAQKAGCPVVAYNSSSIPEVIGTAELLVDNLSVEEILSRLSLIKKKREELINDGICNANRFSWDLTYSKYKKVYEQAWESK